MTRILDSRRREPESGRTDSVVVFLHGFGADGADLIGLAEPISPHLPGTLFLSPDAPERCSVAPGGRQWFPIPWIDGSDPSVAEAGLDAAAADLDSYLDAVLRDEGVTPDRLAVVGFSQGTMMALQVVPRRAQPIAALVGFSGRLLRPELLADEVVSRPPVLLVHGDMDDVVPPASLPEAAERLQAAGFDVFAHVMKGTGHGIAPDGLSVALAFLRERFGIDRGG